MQKLEKKIIVDEQGEPVEAIIAWSDFMEIVEILGLDLDTAAKTQIQNAKLDREQGRLDQYQSLDDI
jgi:hypothetical protein